MLSGEGNAGERWKTTIGLVSKKSNFARAAHFFVHFFAVVLHEYNMKLLSYTFYGGNVVRVFVHFFFPLPLIFTLHWWQLAFPILSPPLQNFHVVLPKKKMSPLFFISRSRPLSPFFSLSFTGPSPTFSFSVFLLLYIPNLWTWQLIWTKYFRQHGYRNNFRFPLIDSLVVSALQDASGYAISRQNNLELHLGCHTCWVILHWYACGSDGRSVGVRLRDYQIFSDG